MAVKKRSLNHAQLKRANQIKRDVAAAIEAKGLSLSEIGSVGSQRAHYRKIANLVLAKLDAALFADSAADPMKVADALIKVVAVRVRNDSRFAAEEKQDLEKRFRKLEEFRSRCRKFQKTLKALSALYRLRPEGLDTLLQSERIQTESGRGAQELARAAEIREVLSTPEVKRLVLKYGSFDKAISVLMDVLPDLAYYGSIPWMCDQHRFSTEAEDKVLQTWIPLAKKAFGAPRLDLLEGILRSEPLKGFTAMKATREALKMRSKRLGLSEKRGRSSR